MPAQPTERPETYISVDVETAGPTPHEYAMLSIGACLVSDPTSGFYVELKPTTDAVAEGALEISGLSMQTLADAGLTPKAAMRQFEDWIELVTPRGHAPIMVAFNAVFDWMFIDTYFHRFLGRNPFGHSALDIKAYYMGFAGGSWAGTSMRVLSPLYLGGQHLTHNALGDARDQADIFRQVQVDAARQRGSD